MLSFIIYIIIICIVVSKVRKASAKGTAGNLQTYDRLNSPQNPTKSNFQKPTRAQEYLQSHPGAVSGGSRVSPPKAKAKGHDHAYVHKVKPLDTATVVEARESGVESQSTIARLQSKREENDRKQQIEEEREIREKRSEYASRNSGRNGDRNPEIRPGEKIVVCSYCGAKNIVLQRSAQKYTCYFCREDL